MSWAKLDDDFYDHRKIVRLLDEPDGLAAVGLWAICLSWARKHRNRGSLNAVIPHGVPRRLSGCDPSLPSLLVKVGLWHDHADGWEIHDFAEYLPSYEMSRARAAAGAKGGIKSGQVRKAAGERSKMLQNGSMGLVVDEATCFENEARPKHAGGEVIGSSKELEVVDTSVRRNDVERLCSHLADKIQANGSKRPVISKAWRDAARRMLDLDGRTEDQITRAIDWCQADEFWRANILSMPTLRKQYDRLRLAAKRNGNGDAVEKPRVAPRDEHMMRR